MPWHHSKRGDGARDARLSVSGALAVPVFVSALKPGDKFETLHTNRLGKIVSCCPEQDGMNVQLYIPGEGWTDRVLHHSCLVRMRE